MNDSIKALADWLGLSPSPLPLNLWHCHIFVMYLCLALMAVLTARWVWADIKRRRAYANGEGLVYIPGVSIGDVIWPCMVSMVPALNIVALVIFILPSLLDGAFDWLDDLINAPLVPPLK